MVYISKDRVIISVKLTHKGEVGSWFVLLTLNTAHSINVGVYIRRMLYTM